MAKIINLFEAAKRDEEPTEETKVDELFDSIIEQNKRKKLKAEKDRAQHNESVKRSYKLTIPKERK